MSEKKATMPGGLTREEFDGLRKDLQHLLSAHPRSKFTLILLDREGRRTEDPARAVRYGLTVHEDEDMLYEEYGDVVEGEFEKRR